MVLQWDEARWSWGGGEGKEKEKEKEKENCNKGFLEGPPWAKACRSWAPTVIEKVSLSKGNHKSNKSTLLSNSVWLKRVGVTQAKQLS